MTGSVPMALRKGRSFAWLLALALGAASIAQAPVAAQERGSPEGEWRYIGGDAWHTRYSPLDQINADNFEDLDVAWVWRGDNYGPYPLGVSRSTPLYVDGMLYTVAGQRRTVVAIDPATGETIWTYREPHTTRFERGMRNGHGKGVAYAEVDGRGVIYISSPAFFLYAPRCQDRSSARGLGKTRAAPGLSPDRGRGPPPGPPEDWGPWQSWDGPPYDPDFGDPPRAGTHHQFVASHRGERRRGGGQFRRAGLPPDSDRDGPGRHSGL